MSETGISKEKALEIYGYASKKEKGFLEKSFGKQIFIGDATSQVKSFEDATSQVKSFEDACGILGIDTSLPDVSAMPREDQKALVAHYKLIIIVRALNDGWTPDWSDNNQYKYYPWFKMARSGFGFSNAHWTYTGTDTTVSSRLCFKSEELARYAGKQFEEFYREYLTINLTK